MVALRPSRSRSHSRLSRWLVNKFPKPTSDALAVQPQRTVAGSGGTLLTLLVDGTNFVRAYFKQPWPQVLHITIKDAMVARQLSRSRSHTASALGSLDKFTTNVASCGSTGSVTVAGLAELSYSFPKTRELWSKRHVQ